MSAARMRWWWVWCSVLTSAGVDATARVPDELLGFWRDGQDPAAWIEYREDEQIEWLDGRRMSASPIDWQTREGQRWIRFPGDPDLGEQILELTATTLRLRRQGVQAEIRLSRLLSSEALAQGLPVRLQAVRADPGGGGCRTLLTGFNWQASSQLPASGNADYEPVRLLDGRSDTAWVEGVDGGGVGERLQLRLDEVRQQTVPPTDGEGVEPVEAIVLEGLRLINGYPRSERLFRANGRVAEFMLRLGERPLGRWSVQDHEQVQTLGLQPPLLLRRDERLLLELSAVVAGARWQDTALAELQPVVHGCGQILAVD